MERINGGLEELSGGWVGRLFDAMHTDARRSAAGAYLVGLLDSNPRKSLRAIADRTSHVAYHQIHHYMNSCAVKEGPVREELLKYAVNLGSRSPAYIVTEDVVIRKRGCKSAGAAHLSIRPDQRPMNCQIIVSVAIVRGSYVIPIAMHLIEPQKLDHAHKSASADDRRWHEALSSEKAEIVIREIRRIKKAGIRISGIITDASIWNCAKIRKFTTAREIGWIVRVPLGQKFYRHRTLAINEPPSKIISDEEICGEEMLKCSNVWATPHLHFSVCTNWPVRAGSERVRLGVGSSWSDESSVSRPIQLVVETYRHGESECYISNMHVTRAVHSIVETMQSYWFCRRTHSQMLEKFGLTKFAGRSRVGLSRHLLLVSIAYLYREHLRWDNYNKTSIN